MEREVAGTDPARFRDMASQEASVLFALWMEGVVRESYFRADRDEALLVLEAEGVEQARHHLERLPFVQNGLITFDVIPLRTYPGFQRLFREDLPPSDR